MKVRFFKIYLLLSGWCFYLHAHIPYEEEKFPSQHLEQASHAIFKLWGYHTSHTNLTDDVFEITNLSQGSGFFIAPENPNQKHSNHFITNCHVAHALLRDNNPLESIAIFNLTRRF